jgi:hypothetical protein
MLIPELLLYIASKKIPILKKQKSLFYFSEINTRAIAYMTIDINRRLLVWYGFINILNTITQLNEQLPICLMNEHMLIVVYTSILHLSTWNYSTDITTLQALDHEIKNLLSNRFVQFYHNPLADQFQVN